MSSARSKPKNIPVPKKETEFKNNGKLFKHVKENYINFVDQDIYRKGESDKLIYWSGTMTMLVFKQGLKFNLIEVL